MTAPTPQHRISVVIASYNAAAFIDEALTSVWRQTLPVHEAIVVDDHSTDDSAARAERLGARVIRLPTNSGPAVARNRGIAATTGDIIACLDSDDYWDDHHCETVVPLLDRFPEAAVAFSRVRFVGSWSGESSARLPALVPVDAFWESVRGSIPPMMSAFIRRARLVACGGYDERLRAAEDYDLFLRLARRHPFVCTHEVTANYRGHQAQASVRPYRTRLYGWDARRYLLERSRATESPEFVSRLEQLYRDLFSAHLRDAWREGDRALLRQFLAIAPEVPGGAAIARRWRRYGWFWWAVRMWDTLPPHFRAGLRRLVRRTR